jgi:hypothetical protein
MSLGFQYISGAGIGKGMAIADFADLWRDQVSNLELIELAQEPRLAGKENGCRLADPAVNGWGRMGSMKE